MPKTIGQQQKQYMIAKSKLMNLESMIEDVEREYIRAKGIVNPDGSVPRLVFCIENDNVFDVANEEVSAIVAKSGLERDFNKARKAFLEAEENLIKFGLSIAPASIREILARGIRNNVKIREKFIDTTLRLDVSTINP